MNSHEKDPYEKMSDDAFKRAEEAWSEIDEKFDNFDYEEAGPQQSAGSSSWGSMPRTQEEKNLVTGVHASALLGYIFPMAWVIAPLVLWLAKKDESAAVDAHGRDVLNFQISMVIYLAIAGMLSIILIGIPFLFVLGIVQLVATIMGTVKASQGERFKYPWTLKIL